MVTDIINDKFDIALSVNTVAVSDSNQTYHPSATNKSKSHCL